jgi:hypothetical protein
MAKFESVAFYTSFQAGEYQNGYYGCYRPITANGSQAAGA